MILRLDAFKLFHRGNKEFDCIVKRFNQTPKNNPSLYQIETKRGGCAKTLVPCN